MQILHNSGCVQSPDHLFSESNPPAAPYLRRPPNPPPPPPPRLHDPRSLSALDCHPPPLPPPKADDPLLLASSPHPREEAELLPREPELGFCTLFQVPSSFFCQPLPVFLYWLPLAVAYWLPLADLP